MHRASQVARPRRARGGGRVAGAAGLHENLASGGQTAAHRLLQPAGAVRESARDEAGVEGVAAAGAVDDVSAFQVRELSRPLSAAVVAAGHEALSA